MTTPIRVSILVAALGSAYLTALPVAASPGALPHSIGSVTSTSTSKVKVEPEPPGGEKQPAEPSGPDAVTLRNEELIDAEAAKIDRARLGYATLRAQPADLKLEILWKGDPPDDVRKMEGTSASGVRIVIVPVAHSEAERLKAGERLMMAAVAKGTTIPRPEVITATKEYDGLRVGITSQRLQAVNKESARAGMEKVAGMRVEVYETQPIVEASRQDDSDPWFGGGAMDFSATAASPTCSTGFAVRDASTGRGYLLSARHCDSTGNHAWWNNRPISPTYPTHRALANANSAFRTDFALDSLEIDPIGGTNGWVNGGPWNATASDPRYHLKVSGKGNNIENDSGCTSGAMSGEHCMDNVVDDLNAQVFCYGSSTICYRERIYSYRSNPIGIQGDSGGPEYHKNSSDSRVEARGIITQTGGNTASCPTANGTQMCSTIVYVANITDILNRWNRVIEAVP